MGNGGRIVSRGTTGGGIRVTSSSAVSLVTSGLVLHLDAGDPASYPGTGTTWYDLSGQGNDSILTNGPTYDTDAGGNIDFDGIDDYASAGDASLPIGTTAGTLSAWARTETTAGNTAWIFAYGYPGTGLARFIGRLGSTFYFGGYNDDLTALGVPLNTWFNITGVYDGFAASLYINGILVTGPTAKSWNTVSSDTVVGRQVGGGGEYWQGGISQVLIYDRALSDGEIVQNFNTLCNRHGLPPV